MSKIIIIAPAPIAGSGGVARIYNFAQALIGQGHDCHLYVFNSDGANASALTDNAIAFYSASGFTIHTSLDTIKGEQDLVIATRWDTAAMSFQIEARHRAYLIQDYEAYFNPVGDGSLLAENSYMLGLRPLTYGRWLAFKLKRDFNNTPYHFDFASDTDAFRCDVPMEQRLHEKPNIAFVYQADKTRRCPIIGIEALRIVKRLRPEVTLSFVGSNDAPHTGYDLHNVGNLTIEQLNALYNRCHIGLSLSSSNPSCNAFDMMAAGLPSVDLYRENNLYDVPPQGVLLAYQSAASIAEAIVHLLDNPAELLARSRSGIEFMASRSQRYEVESFLSAVSALLEGRATDSAHAASDTALYDRPPVVARIDRNEFVDAYLHKQLAVIPQADARQNAPFSTRGKKWWPTSKEVPAKEPRMSYYPTSVCHDLPADTQDQPAAAEQAVIADQPTVAEKYERLGKRLIRRFGLDPRLSAYLFDPDHYLAHSPDVGAAGMDPFKHFIRYGMAEGRSPSPFFEAEWYDTLHPEDQRGGLSPIGHYITHGSALNQSPNSMFDSIWYLTHYPDVRASRLHPLLHFVQYGEAERRDPSSKFSTSWYLETNPDVASSSMSPLCHYIAFGREEGRQPVPSRQRLGRETWQFAGRPAGAEMENIFSRRPQITDFEPDVARDEREILNASQCEEGQASFDVWSTIIHRRCHPDEIKLRSARFLLLNAWDEVRPALRSPVHLMSARMRAENNSAPHGDYEYRFTDAIGPWLRDVLIPSCSATRRAELATLLGEHELAAESDSIELDENVANTIRSLKKAPIFISDFYMESHFIESLLGKVGLRGHFIKGYSSCDIFKNKRSGELFRHVLNDFQINAADLIHIGDNPISDFERPASLGIKAISYVSHADEERNDWYTKAFNQYCAGDLTLHRRRMLALIETIASKSTNGNDDSPDDDALFSAGCRIGLLAFGYCLNVMQDAIARKAKEVVFFAREGIFFKEIYDLIAAQDPFNTPAPPSRLLYVSRRATFAASLRSYDNKELMRLWTMYSRQSPNAFASSLNLDLSKAAIAARRAGIQPDEAVLAPWSDTRFQAFLNDPKFKRYATEQLALQRDLLRRYLNQEIDLETNEVLIADIGWRGTIQDNIAHVLEKPVRGHYLALFRYLNQQAAGSSKVAWLSDSNTESDYSLPDQVAPIEMIFNGPGGSTIGYEERDGRIEPIRELFAAEEATVEALAPCRAGMLAAVPALARYVKLHGLMAGDLRDLNREVAGDLLATPPAVIADVFGRLEHNETFGVGAVEAMDDLGFAEVSETKPGPELHNGLTTWLGTRWPEGMSRQSIVTDWWRSAAPEALASAPLPISRARFPAIVRGTGSRLAVYVPAPLEASGGYRTIMNTVKALVDVGFNAEIYVETVEGTGDLLDRYIGDMPATIVSSWAVQKTPTLALATIAHSAGFVASAIPAHYKGYLVQDDESVFHPLSEASIRAENSYSYGLHHFTIGNWLTHLIRNKYGVPAYPAGFGIDTGIYRVLEDIRREQAICILYQPEKTRRASDIALRAAEIVKRIRPQTEVYVYGSPHAPNLDCEHHNLGVVNDLTELNALYNRCRAGVCLSLSNPSRIPFEMAAAGCRPVDVYRYNNLMDHISGVSTLAFQSAESIAEGILTILDSDDYVPAELAGQMRYRTLSWESDAIVSNVLRVLENRPDEGWALQPSYDDDPVLAAVDDTPAARAFCQQQRAAATN